MRTLSKRLAEKGFLRSREEHRGKHTIRKMLQGARQVVLHLDSAVLLDAAGPKKDDDKAASEPGSPSKSEPGDEEGAL